MNHLMSLFISLNTHTKQASSLRLLFHFMFVAATCPNDKSFQTIWVIRMRRVNFKPFFYLSFPGVEVSGSEFSGSETSWSEFL